MVDGRGQAFADFDLDSQFFAQLAPQRIRERLARLAFPAGEFPKPAQVVAGPALGEQDTPRAKD